MSLSKRIISLVLALLMVFSLSINVFADENDSAKSNKKNDKADSTAVDTSAVDEIIMSYNNPNGRILCVASYGDLRNYPENSLEGINSAIKFGADIITVSVQKTKDNQFVLLTDKTLARMCVNQVDGTPASGKVADYTVEQLQSEFFLRASKGGDEAKATKYKIATLEDAIEACQGKAMLMINNGWPVAEEINTLARKVEACEILIIRNVPTAADASAFVDKVGIPVCNIVTNFGDATEGSPKDYISSSLNAGAKMVELSAEKSYASIYNKSTINKFKDAGRPFISTTEQNLCGGRDDLIVDWADLIERGYSVIETDYPKELASYIGEIEAYRAELTSLIMQAQGLNTSKYTKETSKALSEALEQAEDLSGTGCVSLNEIDKARYDIQESLDSLVIKTGDEKTTLPGFVIAIIVIVAIIVLAVLAIFGLRFFNKKKAQRRKMARFKDKFKNVAPEANDHLVGLTGDEGVASMMDDVTEDFSSEVDSVSVEDTARASEILANLESELESDADAEEDVDIESMLNNFESDDE